MYNQGKWLPPLANKACGWLVKSLGFLQVLLVSAGYSTDFCRLPHSHVVLCLCLCSVWTLGSPLNSAFHSFPPMKSNRQGGREAEKRDKEAEKTKESERSRQTDNIKKQERGKAAALFLCVFTLTFTQPWACRTAVCPGSDQEIIAGGSGSSPHPAFWGYWLIPYPRPWILCTQEYLLRKQLSEADILVWITTEPRPHSHIYEAQRWTLGLVEEKCVCVHSGTYCVSCTLWAVYTNKTCESTYKSTHTHYVVAGLP